MIDRTDLSRIAIFAELAPEEQARFAQKAGDVRSEPAETIVYQGEQSKFYVILEGSAQVFKDIHGVLHPLGKFTAGDFFGGLNCLMGISSGVAVIATTQCRVARFEMQQLQELIQPSAPSSGLILREMSARLLEIQRYAQGVPSTRVILTSQSDNRMCQRIKSFLNASHIPYEWNSSVSASDVKTQDHLEVVIDGQHELSNPTLREVVDALGFQTRPKRENYDVLIIGAGPAGMAAGVYGASEGLRVLLVERGSVGGQAGTSSRIENYLGFPSGISGDDLSDRALKQALRFGAEIAMARTVETISPGPRGYAVRLDGGEEVTSRTVLIATGVEWRLLNVPGLDEYLGKGVLYGASRTEALSVTGKRVFIVGGGNSAGQAAMFFSDYAKEVRLLVRGPSLASSMSQYLISQLAGKQNVSTDFATEVVAFRGDGFLQEVVTATLQSRGSLRERIWPVDALFVMIGADANTGWLPSELQKDGKGFICTGRAVTGKEDGSEPLPLETSMPGIFCAGDVRHGSIKRVASGVGEGSMSIAFIHEFLASAL
jgi:thioredoxin reductase (NADPH)